MKISTLILLFLLSCFKSIAQSETDSLFYFNYSFNYTTSEKAQWISNKEKVNDSTFKVTSIKVNSNRESKQEDEYNIISVNRMTINRYFSNKYKNLPGNYKIEVDIIDTINDVYILDLYSYDLNIHKTVQSKTMIPICPIEKTIFYHPNCVKSKAIEHETNVDSLWNSQGEPMNVVYWEKDLDSLPVLYSYPNDQFKIALQKSIQLYLKYPTEAIEADIDGKVYASFIITSSGNIEHIEIVRGIHPLIDKASLDFLRKLKIKTPAMKEGKPVNFFYHLPFIFHVQ